MKNLKERLRRWLACPNLAPPPEAMPAKPEGQAECRRPMRRWRDKWPEFPSRPAKIGPGRSVTIESAHDFLAVTFRIADFGLLTEFSLRVASFSVRITEDLLEPDA